MKRKDNIKWNNQKPEQVKVVTSGVIKPQTSQTLSSIKIE